MGDKNLVFQKAGIRHKYWLSKLNYELNFTDSGNNPRKNDDAVNAVAESIRQCSYITPIIVDEDHVIIVGHTRYKALVALGMDDVECLVCDGLTEEQKKNTDSWITRPAKRQHGI